MKIKLFLTTFFLLILSTLLFTKDTFACCSDSECTGIGSMCSNIPPACGAFGAGSGVCISGWETCEGSSNSTACTPPQVCIDRLCQISGSGGGGGGTTNGGCWEGAVNCPSGSTIALDQPIETFCSRNFYFGSKLMCSSGSAQRITGCCGGMDPEGSCTNPQYTTYNCCNSSSESQCTTTYSNYITSTSCGADVEISRVQLACYLTTNDKGNWVWVCPIQITCRKATTTCVCVPSCTPTAPAAPTLLSPSDGATVSTTSVNLSWSGNSWGKGCPTTSNIYKLYIGTVVNNLSLVSSTTNTFATFNGVSGQKYYWRVEEYNGSLSTSSITRNFTINVPPAITTPWWQVKDGDITASSGDILSHVPATYFFDVDGVGGFPGIPVYNGAFIYTPGNNSSKNWSANTQTTQGRIFDYTYFKNLIPDTVTPTTNASLLSSSGFIADGYEWFKINGDLSINDIDFGNRKVILFIENGNLTINGKLNVNDGVGFFGAFVDGNINVKSTVTGTAALEGIYLSDGTFTSEVAATQLHVRGSVASYGGITLQRDLVDDSTAAELFEYAPDQILLFPKKLAYRRTKWAEIAP